MGLTFGIDAIKLMAILGIGISLFALSLVVIKVPPRTIAILFGVGGALVASWLYVDYRTAQNRRQQQAQQAQQDQTRYEVCKCTICTHDYADKCIRKKCPCCTIEKENKLVHGVHSLT